MTRAKLLSGKLNLRYRILWDIT